MDGTYHKPLFALEITNKLSGPCSRANKKAKAMKPSTTRYSKASPAEDTGGGFFSS